MAASLLRLLPENLCHFTSEDLGGTQENDWQVARFEDTRVFLDRNDRRERLDGIQCSFLLKVNDVAGGDCFVFTNSFDAEVTSNSDAQDGHVGRNGSSAIHLECLKQSWCREWKCCNAE